MTPSSGLEACSAVRDRVAHYVAISEALVAAIAEGEEARVRQALDRIRSQRDAVRHMLEMLDRREIPGTAAGVELLRQFLQWRKVIASHDEVILRWLQTIRRPGRELLASSQGVQRFVDLELPLEWNVLSDQVVLCGDGIQAVANELCRRGQRRLYVYWPSDQPPSGFPPPAVVCRNASEFQTALCGACDKVPEQTLFLGIDGGIGDGELDELRRLVRDARSFQQVSLNTNALTGEQRLAQRMQNLCHIASFPSLASLAGAFSGRPALIVSPGPSLAKNIETVAALKGRAVLLTSVQTLLPLHRYRLIPDLSLNAELLDMRYVLGELSAGEVGRLALSFSSHPSLFSFGAPVFTFSSDWNMDDWVCALFGQNSRLSSGGSVSCSAFALALELGCDPVVLVGQDLSYSSEGEVYVASSPHAKSRVIFRDGAVEHDFSGLPEDVRALSESSRRQAAIELPGYYGGKVSTSLEFALFHRWFESMAKYHPGRRLFNCTEGGVFIQGMEHRPLAEVAAAYMTCQFDVEAPFQQAESADFRVPLERAQTWVEQTSGLLTRAVELARKCKALAQGSPGSELLGCEAELSQLLSPLQFMAIVDPKALFEVMESARVAVNVEQRLAASRRLCDTVLRAGDRVLPLLTVQGARLQATLASGLRRHG